MLILLIIISSCTSSVRFASGGFSSSQTGRTGGGEPVQIGTVIYGKASYYGDEFQGRKTSNGETYDRSKLSAAHKTFPFDTLLKVKNIKNGKEVFVRINDRGPFVQGRILDLSFAAAVTLDMLKYGVIDVEITIME